MKKRFAPSGRIYLSGEYGEVKLLNPWGLDRAVFRSNPFTSWARIQKPDSINRLIACSIVDGPKGRLNKARSVLYSLIPDRWSCSAHSDRGVSAFLQEVFL